MRCIACKRSRAISKTLPFCSQKCAQWKHRPKYPMRAGMGYNTRIWPGMPLPK